MFIIAITLLLCILVQILMYKKFNQSRLFTTYHLITFFNNFSKIKHFITKKSDQEAFLATLIHDLKTPTTAQIRTLNMLLDGYFGTLNNTQKEILEEALCSEKYMSELVSNILTAYKCDCNELKLKKVCFNAPDILNNIYSTIKHLANEKGQTLSINYHCEQLFFVADALQISRVMTNLISNAIKYGTPSTVITTDLTIKKGKMIFTVTNKGEIIPKEKLAHIFEKFNGGMTHYNSASTGLGLYLSKKIIELHGGKIFANCTQNGIITFGFELKNNIQIQNNPTRNATFSGEI